jgi:hypothetical protein
LNPFPHDSYQSRFLTHNWGLELQTFPHDSYQSLREGSPLISYDRSRRERKTLDSSPVPHTQLG